MSFYKKASISHLVGGRWLNMERRMDTKKIITVVAGDPQPARKVNHD